MAQPTPGRPRAQAPRPALPRRVYLVRRLLALAVLAVLVLVVVLVVKGLAGSGGSDDGGDPRPTTTATGEVGATAAGGEAGAGDAGEDGGEVGTLDAPRTAAEEAALAAGVPVCTLDDLDLDFEATADAYAGTDKPAFRIVYTNTGDEPCLVDAGEQARRIVVTSGGDTVWSSTHCRREPESRPLLLGPDEPSEETYRWQRVRSVKGCTPGQPAPKPGTYTARFEVDGQTVAKAVFDLR